MGTVKKRGQKETIPPDQALAHAPVWKRRSKMVKTW